ncbi:hypothetical protein IK146_01760 [Candidatus Saccharibacteria bacterium]|nr:hypothetical protein [Candidatus Saccharibacteria bacterium]
MRVTRREIVDYMNKNQVDQILAILEAFGFKTDTTEGHSAMYYPRANLVKLILSTAISLYHRGALSGKMTTELIEHFGRCVGIYNVIKLTIECSGIDDRNFDKIPEDIRVAISDSFSCSEKAVSAIQDLTPNMFETLLLYIVRETGWLARRYIVPLLLGIRDKGVIDDDLLLTFMLGSVAEVDTDDGLDCDCLHIDKESVFLSDRNS